MKLPVEIVYELLMNDQTITSLVNPDYIFTVRVPEDYQKVENAPIIRINEINDYQSSFANNRAIEINITVQVDVWAKDLGTLREIRQALDNLLSKHQWVQRANALDDDPDIDLIRMARRYTATNQVNF
ncbi:tail completion protein gp17 [Bacillus sp. FSL M8-0168]|uniref:tail completion protein gp17 n=1 Tax=Bacillus sp. FSL M8-0168 TaxID=2921614 RepID=UPI0030FD5A58